MSKEPIIVQHKNPNHVTPEHRNKIVVTTVFKLRDGALQKENIDDQIIIKEFPSDTVSDERKEQIRQEIDIIYHHMLLKMYDPELDDYLNVIKFQEFLKEHQEQKDWVNQPLDQQVFVKYRFAESVGCPHYIKGCDLLCPTCNKYFPCRMCHEETEEHTFPRYEIATVRCKYCGEVQPFAQQCQKCGICFGCQYCFKCKLICDMGRNAKPFYHCEKCGVCTIGYIEHNKHCDKCKQCIQKSHFESHKCVVLAEQCPVCLGNMVNSNYATIVLNCMHQMHYHCYKNLIQSCILKCPLCKRYLPMDSDKEWIGSQLLQLYQQQYQLPDIAFSRLTHCCDCSRNFVQPFQPAQFYYCPFCKIFNCEVITMNEDIQITDISNMEFPALQQPTEENILVHLRKIFQNADEIIQMIGVLDEESLFKVATVLNRNPHSADEFVQWWLALGVDDDQ